MFFSIFRYRDLRQSLQNVHSDMGKRRRAHALAATDPPSPATVAQRGSRGTDSSTGPAAPTATGIAAKRQQPGLPEVPALGSQGSRGHRTPSPAPCSPHTGGCGQCCPAGASAHHHTNGSGGSACWGGCSSSAIQAWRRRMAAEPSYWVNFGHCCQNQDRKTRAAMPKDMG